MPQESVSQSTRHRKYCVEIQSFESPSEALVYATETDIQVLKLFTHGDIYQ